MHRPLLVCILHGTVLLLRARAKKKRGGEVEAKENEQTDSLY